MNFERGMYYIYKDHLLCYNNKVNFGYGHSFFDLKIYEEIILNSDDAQLASPATKLDLLLRGLDENIRISGSKTASTGKR